ncbi:MAG TPA: OmpA family protein [Phenylobacterium sp.]|jgi:outer membrane protein OmpA-like peptidoglycan-associated protein|nr:OmpA family protein [Phenylobacterium sp.]
MPVRTFAPAFAATLALAIPLSGCLTPHVRPPPSQAILEARAGVTAKPTACKPGGLDAISPVDASFGYDDATVTETAHQRLTEAARWLNCNPGVVAVIKPDADNHGAPAHLAELSQRRGQAVVAELRALGATASVIHVLARGAADPVSGPHLVIDAGGRGW